MNNDFIHYRMPLVHTYHRLVVDKKLNIVYFGGSITQGFGSDDPEKTSWRAKVDLWFRQSFPRAEIISVNSSIGESGTYLGVYRLQRDVLSQMPDLLFIEYAVNDLSHGATKETAMMQFETIVREVREAYPRCDIVTIITEAQMVHQTSGLYPAAQGHEEISEAYGIPSVLVGKALSHRIRESKEETWDKYFIDSVHPNDCGYSYYYNCIEEFLCNALKYDLLHIIDKPKNNPELISNHLLDGNRSYVTCNREMLNDSMGFSYSDETYKSLPKTPYKGYIWTNDEGAEFEYSFFGTEMGIYSNFSNYKFNGEIYYSLDGNEYKILKCSIHNPTIIVKNLSEGGHILKIKPIFTKETPDIFKIAAVLTRNAFQQTERIKSENKEITS